jgi:methylenetetrahydrofolate reductase (NADPH)
MGRVATHPDRRDSTAVVARLARTASVELTPREADSHVEALAATLPRGTRVAITALASVPLAAQLAAAERVHEAGLRPVPHIAARSYGTVGDVERHLARLATKAGVEEILLVAGGQARPQGQVDSSLDVLRSGVVQAAGVRRVDVAGHPEGIRGIDADELARALAAKNQVAVEQGLEMRIVTQFAFAAEAYVNWERAARLAGNRLPVTAGIAGVVSARKLLRFAIRCGIGPSIEILRKHRGGVLRLAAGTWRPDGVVTGIAESIAADPDSLIDAVHFFAFGNVLATVEWLHARHQDARTGPGNGAPPG